MVTEEELKELQKQIDVINEKLKDHDYKEATRIAYENLMYDSGYRPCDGKWDRSQGKCIEIKPNTPPVVDAGRDRTVGIGSIVTLVGEATDMENNIVANSWVQDSGASVGLSHSSDGKNATFTATNEGVYGFTFTSKDSEGLSGSDSVFITVNGQAIFKVDAGEDQIIKVETLPVSYKLKGSITGNVSIKSFAWTGLSNIPAGSLTPIVTFNEEGEYTLTLSATDVNNSTNADSVKISIIKEGGTGGEEVKLVPISITASKEDSGKTASMVGDGNFESRWSAAGVGEWIEFKFDKAYQITKVGLTGYHYDKTYTFEINGKTFTNNAGRAPNTLVEYDLKDLNINSDTVRIIGKGNDGSNYNSYREIVFYGLGKPVDPDKPILDVQFPSTIEVLTKGTIDATRSVGDTVTVEQTSSINTNFKQDPTGKYLWTFTPPDIPANAKAVSYNLGFKAEARKGGSVSQKSISIQVTKSGGTGGEGFDEFGMQYLLKPTGKKVAMEKGSDHRNGQRYNVNHKYENHLMQGYYLLGKGQGKIETKEDGPNHGSCDFTKDQICFWWEAGINLVDGKAESQYEWPHADNYDIPDEKNTVLESVGPLKAGNWVGWATAAYWGSDGLRHYKAWCDPNPFPNNDPSQKPNNNWKLVIHLIHTADLITKPVPITIPRNMQNVINYDQGFECEIRMHQATNHDTQMKNAWVFEIVPPQ